MKKIFFFGATSFQTIITQIRDHQTSRRQHNLRSM